ncbi:MAG: hypothetical protein RLZZ300_2591, partial [Pseudomonadota bacterium]
TLGLRKKRRPGNRSKTKAGNAHIDSLLDYSGGRGNP